MNRFVSRFGFGLVVGGAVLGCVLLNGCSGTANVAVGGDAANATQGMVHGGQQPVNGATIQLYSVGTAGDGSAATALLSAVVKTDANGAFTVPAFTCASSSTLLYLVATGGNPGLTTGTNNAALAMMTALGTCGSLGSKFVFVNEATTVAGVWALAPYMSSYSSIGSGSTDAAALASAFTLAGELANTSTGAVPGVNVPAGTTVPVDQINTLADILSACINTAGGVAGDGSTCGKLLSAATPTGGAAPTNVVSAALNIADDPTANIASLYALVVPTAPFQPTVSAAPSNYVVQLSEPAGLTVSPQSLAFAAAFLATPSSAKTVTLTNSSTAAIALSSLKVIGDDAGDFSLTPAGSCSTSLAGSASCTVNVTFTASAVGARRAYLSITNGSAISPVQVALSGAGMANSIGPVSLSPSSITFAARNLGSISAAQTITLTNTGNEALTISGVAITGANTGDFTVVGNTCGTSVAGGGSCVISVTFDPTAAGARSATLQVSSNAVNAPNTALLLGTGN